MRRKRGGVAPGLQCARSRAESRFSLGQTSASGRDSPVGAYYVGRCKRSSQFDVAGKRESRRRKMNGTMVSQNIVTELVVGERSNINNKESRSRESEGKGRPIQPRIGKQEWAGAICVWLVRCSLCRQGCLTFRWAGVLGPSCRALEGDGGRPCTPPPALAGGGTPLWPVHLQRQLKS